jgi:ribonuclease Z
MVDVLFLGTGGAFSAGRRSTLGLLIEADSFRMLAETGPAILEQLARVDLHATDVERLFVSHSHGDHVLGFPMLALNRFEVSTPLQVYAGRATIATLQALCAVVFSNLGVHRLNLEWHELSEVDSDQVALAAGVTLRSVVVPHPPGVPTLAARWDFAGGPSVTFATDTVPSAVTVELARDSDLLIHEASFSAVLQPDEDPAAHFHSTARQAGELARQAGCPRVALVHLGPAIGEQPDVLIEESRAGTDLQVFIPEDGERIHVSE